MKKQLFFALLAFTAGQMFAAASEEATVRASAVPAQAQTGIAAARTRFAGNAGATASQIDPNYSPEFSYVIPPYTNLKEHTATGLLPDPFDRYRK